MPISPGTLAGWVNRALGQTAPLSLRRRFLWSLLTYARATETAHAPLAAEAMNAAFSASATTGSAEDADCVMALLDDTPGFADPSLSRLSSLWLQGARSDVRASDPPFGRLIDTPTLETLRSALGTRALPDSDTVYRTAGGTSIPGERIGGAAAPRRHGTAVTGLALDALTDRSGDGVKAIAIAFPDRVVRDTSGALLPFFLLAGILHAIEQARAIANAPALVLAASYGVLAGAKDGTSPLQRILDALADPAGHKIPGLGPIEIVLPMGNGRQARGAARLDPGGVREIGLLRQPDDLTPCFVEIHPTDPGPGKALSVTLSAPAGSPVAAGPVPARRTAELDPGRGAPVMLYGGVRGALHLAFAPTLPPVAGAEFSPPGLWTIQIDGADDEMVDLFVQRDEALDELSSGGRQARFVDPTYSRWEPSGRPRAVDPPGAAGPLSRLRTINAFAAGSHIWTVGGTWGLRGPGDTVPYSALGNAATETGDLHAPSDLSPARTGLPIRTAGRGAPFRQRGTSMAVPQIAACIADLYATSGKSGTKLARSAIQSAIAAAPPRQLDRRPY